MVMTGFINSVAAISGVDQSRRRCVGTGMREMVLYYQTKRHIGWEWQSIDSKSCPTPLGGEERGRNPTDWDKQGSKIHLLVDERGALLTLHVIGASEHDKWSADDRSFLSSSSALTPRWSSSICVLTMAMIMTMCVTLWLENTTSHIKHRRRRSEPVVEECPIFGELRYPAR
jgi:hypothetical protein